MSSDEDTANFPITRDQALKICLNTNARALGLLGCEFLLTENYLTLILVGEKVDIQVINPEIIPSKFRGEEKDEDRINAYDMGFRYGLIGTGEPDCEGHQDAFDAGYANGLKYLGDQEF